VRNVAAIVTSASKDSDLKSSHDQRISISYCQVFINHGPSKVNGASDPRTIIDLQEPRRDAEHSKTMVTGKRFKEMDSVNYHDGD
jgi:hypothetical protein